MLRRYGLVGEAVNWWVLWFEKFMPLSVFFLFLLLVDQDTSSQLLFQRHACLLSAMLPALMFLESPFEAISPNNIFSSKML